MTSIDFDSVLAAELDALVPLDELARGDWRDVERRAGIARPRPRFLLAATLAATLVGLLVTPLGGAIAREVENLSNWLKGSPAPESVVSDFGSYAPQLGFDPVPGRAVLVARDGGNFSLYATTNKQGSYCLIASAPWKRPSKLPDGGTCIPPAHAVSPLVAGLVGASTAGSEQTYLIAGRTTDEGARAIRFTDPAGAPIERAIGSSGFFVAVVRTNESACASGDWAPTFNVLGADGDARASIAITLGSASASPGVCVFAAPHP
jgi:hypothetical protein